MELHIDSSNSQNSIPKVIVIFPAKNEEGTIAIAIAKKSYYKQDVILVDAYSTDKTIPELFHFEQPLSGEVCARRQVWENLLNRDNASVSPPDGWGIDVWFLNEATISGYHIKEIFMGTKEHTSFEDYREDVSKLSKMAGQVEFTIIREAIKYGKLELQKKVNV